MRKSLRYKPLLLLLALGLLAGCSDDGEDKTTPTPTAAITAVQTTVEVGQIVQLSGEGSRSPNNGYLTYGWSIPRKPQLSEAEILQQDQPTTTFHADLPGTYVVSLTVVNDNKVLSTPATLEITATSTLPVAVAEKEVFRLINKKIELDGSNSTAPDGESARGLTHAWTLSAPSGVTTPTLADADTAWPSFTATAEGMYIAILTVTHGDKVSKPLKTYIMATKGNAAPNARSTITEPSAAPYYRDQPITLSAATSDDDDGDTLQYRWRFAGANAVLLARPVGSQTVLTGADSETVTFTPDVVGIYRVQLDAFDGTTTSTENRNITVVMPTDATSQLPKALGFGIDTSFVSTSSGILEYEIGANAFMTLDAYDPDGGSIGYQWIVEEPPAGWTVQNRNGGETLGSFQALVNGRTGTLYGGTNFSPTGSNYVGNDGGFRLVPPSGFQYRNPIDLKVKVILYDAQNPNPDPADTSNRVEAEYTLRLMTGANRKPKAYAGTDFTQVLVGSEVLLNGGYEDLDDNAITDWQWVLMERPQGSNASIANPKIQYTSFIADKVGNYRISLVVTDSLGAKSNDALGILPTESLAVVTAKPFSGGNNRPTARFTGVDTLKMPPNTGYYGITQINYDEQDQVYPYRLGSIKDRNCTTWSELYTSCEDNVRIHFKTYDPDGDTLVYDVLLQQPAGSGYQNSYTNKITATDGTDILNLMDLAVPGDYNLTLQALDGVAISSPQYLTLRVTGFPADYTAFKVHYCYEQTRGMCTINEDGTGISNMTFLPLNGTGASGGNSNAARYETYLDGGSINHYVLEAVGQDYTLEDIRTYIFFNGTEQTVEGEAYQPRFINLPADNIIRAGERRVIGMHIPKMLPRQASDQSVNYFYEFYLKEERHIVRDDNYRPGYFRHYEQFSVPRLAD